MCTCSMWCERGLNLHKGQSLGAHAYLGHTPLVVKTKQEQTLGIKLKVQVKSYPITGLGWPLEFRELRLP